MTGDTFYNDGARALQDRFDSRRIADRLETLKRTAFTEDDKTFIESAIYFFLATADDAGHCRIGRLPLAGRRRVCTGNE